MALSERHLVMGTLVACAAIAAVKLPPVDRGPARMRTTAMAEVRERDRLMTHLRRETAMLALLERRDSVLRAAGTAPRGTMPRVLHDADVPPALRTAIDDAIGREVAALGVPVTHPVVLRVLVDTGSRGHRWGAGYSRAAWLESDYVLPPAADGRTCVVMVRVGARAIEEAAGDGTRGAGWIAGRHAGRFLGPCAWYGAHGLPGVEIERWLAAARLSFARRAPVPDADSVSNPVRWMSPAPAIAVASGVEWWHDRVFHRRELVRCAEGSDADCASALREPRSGARSPRSPWLLDDDGTPGYGALPLGPAEPWLLAALHERLGPERFGRFWRSALPPEDAFRDVMGITLSAATGEWARATYGARTRRSWPHPGALAGQLLLAGGVVGAAALRRRRSTMS